MAKRPSEEDFPPLVNKVQRIEQSPGSPLLRQHNEDFSGSVKRKLAESKRTGQACDRCKVCIWCAYVCRVGGK